MARALIFQGDGTLYMKPLEDFFINGGLKSHIKHSEDELASEKQEEVNKFWEKNSAGYKGNEKGLLGKITNYLSGTKAGKALRRAVFGSMFAGYTAFAAPKSNVPAKLGIVQVDKGNDNPENGKQDGAEKYDSIQKTLATGNLVVYLHTSDDSTAVTNYSARLKSSDGSVDKSVSSDSNMVAFNEIPTPVKGEGVVPLEFRLGQNYPNPFNPSTTIGFSLDKPGPARLDIYNIEGRLIKTIINQYMNAGNYAAVWMGENNEGKAVAQGVYFYRLTADGQSLTKKMVDLGSAGGKSSWGIAGTGNQLPAAQKIGKIAGTNYVLELTPTDSSKPDFYAKSVSFEMSSDTSLDVYVARFVNPSTFASLNDITIKEDEPLKKDSIVADLKGKAKFYDKNNQPVPDSLIDYAIIQSNSGLVGFRLDENRYILFDSLAADGNGESQVTVRATDKEDGRTIDGKFNVMVNPMRDIRGTLTDDENNPQMGYILVYNAQGDSSAVKTDSLGKFALQMKPTAGDTVKGQIYNKNHPGGFIRKMYFAGAEDTDNVKVDAVPQLPDSFYVSPDTALAWVIQGNFQPVPGAIYWGLKKNIGGKEIISSINASSGDTMTIAEQQRVMDDLQTYVDVLFTKKPTYYIVPQDSAMQLTGLPDAITHFKDYRISNATLSTWDDNNDGILDGGLARYNYIIRIQAPGDTVYKDLAITREDFRARVMPNEVDNSSSTPKWLTLTHIGSTAGKLTPADAWWANVAEHYPGKTDHTTILIPGNLEDIYNNMQKQNKITVANSHMPVEHYAKK